MDFSFIHVSDIHLGRPFSDLSKFSCDEKSRKIYSKAVENSLKKIVEFALMKNVDFVFIAGDTFDSIEQDFSSQLILKESLKKLSDSDIDVYMICGNHDPVCSYCKNTFNFESNSKVKIIGLDTPSYVDLPLYNKNGNKVGVVHALSFTEEKYNKNPILEFSKIKEDEKTLFNVGLLHCDLNADSNSPYAPCLVSDLKNLNYNYWALGHIHLPMEESEIVYSGTIQGRNTKETGEHGIRYVRVENCKVIKNTFVSMDIVRFEDITFDVSVVDNIVDVANYVSEKINQLIGNEKNTCEIYLLRLTLSGCVPFYTDINSNFVEVLSEKIKTSFYSKVYISQIKNETTPLIEETLLKEDEGIVGSIYKVINEEMVTQKVYDELEEKYKNIIGSCNFDVENYKNYKQDIIKKAKEYCLNICSSLYEIKEKED